MSGSLYGAAAVVQAFVGILDAYLYAALSALCAAQGVTPPASVEVTGERAAGVQWANRVLVFDDTDTIGDLPINLDAPIVYKGTVLVLAMVAVPSITQSETLRRLWAESIRNVILRYWRVWDDNAAVLRDVIVRTDMNRSLSALQAEVRGMIVKERTQVEASLIDPVLVRVEYQQSREQTIGV